MVQVTQRTALGGPALIRLLARVADVEITESRQSLSDRLSQWLHWTDAIALSTALGNGPASGGPLGGMPLGGNPLGGNPLGGMPRVLPAGEQAHSSIEKECAAARDALTSNIVTDGLFGTPKKRLGAREPDSEAATELPVFRQRYLTLQQTMETGTGNLRVRLRAKLAVRTPAMKRLAEVDAVMEHALSPRERTLLANVPVLLGKHFEHLRRSEVDALETPEAWLELFRKDTQNVLLAELDLRFQPVEGLLAALRAS